MSRRATVLNFETATLPEVVKSMQCTPTQEGFVRLQGITFLYKGYSKNQVAELLGISLRAVQQWVKDFNEAGIDGILGSRRTGRKRKIAPDVFASKYKPQFLSSAQTALCFYGKLRTKYQERISYSTLLNYLHEQNLTRTVGRSICIQRDPEKREQFLVELNKYIEQGANIWFCDEVGFDGDPKPRKRWIEKGKKYDNPFYKLHLRSSAIGAANPETGEFFSHVVPFVDTGVFQHYIEELNKFTKNKHERGEKIVLVLDNASWHRTNNLKLGHLEVLFLPPYSPDLNPIEQLWRVVKERFFNGWYAENIDELDERVCQALQSLIADPAQVISTASMEYMKR